jgi:hypothetical protein
MCPSEHYTNSIYKLEPQPKRRLRKPAHAIGPAFNEMPLDLDPRWIDLPEKDRAYGPRPDSLVRLVTRPCYPSNEDYISKNHHFRCIASTVCNWKQKSLDRQLCRLYKHVSECRALRQWNPDLFAAAERAYANMAPGGFESLAISTTTDDNTIHPPSKSPIALPVASNPFAQFDPTPRMSHLQQIDHAIARLLCDSASPARLVDYPAWGKLIRLINPQLEYSSPKSTQVRDRLIPAEAQRAVLHMREYLKTQTNISLSFDGLNAGEQPVYTVHTCTADRRTFLYYADVFYGSHNSDYIVDLLTSVSGSSIYWSLQY